MRKVNKITAAVAMAIGTAGLGVADASYREVLYPYVVTSPTVTTILTVVSKAQVKKDQLVTLHWRYFTKAQTGDAKADRDALCGEIDHAFTGSANDLVDVSVDEFFNNNHGAMYNDQTDYSLNQNDPWSLGLLKFASKPRRGFAIVDNFQSTKCSKGCDLTAARATIVEYENGAAWGYDGYRDERNNYDFSEPNEVFGEVIGDGGVDISWKPFADGEWITNLYVTPISESDNKDAGDNVKPINQAQGKLRTRVTLNPDTYDAADDTVLFDRDESPWSGQVPVSVTCVGAINIKELIDPSLYGFVEDQGGWSTVWLSYPPANGATDPTIRTDEATVLFLEYNQSSFVDGKDVGGIVNNGFMLRENGPK